MYQCPTHKWYLERIVWLIAGIVVLGGTCLGLFVNRYWFALPMLAGLNMIVFSFTGFCPMAVLLNKAFDIRPLVDRRDVEEKGKKG